MSDIPDIEMKICDGEYGVNWEYEDDLSITHVLPNLSLLSMDPSRTIEQNLPLAHRGVLKGKTITIQFNAKRSHGCFDIDNTGGSMKFKDVPCDNPTSIPGDMVDDVVCYDIRVDLLVHGKKEEVKFIGRDTVLNIIHFILEHWGLSVVIEKEAFDELEKGGIPGYVIVDWLASKLPVFKHELKWRDAEIKYLEERLEDEAGIAPTK